MYRFAITLISTQKFCLYVFKSSGVECRQWVLPEEAGGIGYNEHPLFI